MSQQTRLITQKARTGHLLAFQLPVAQEGFAQLQLANERKQALSISVLLLPDEQNPNASARQAVVPKDFLAQADGATAQARTSATPVSTRWTGRREDPFSELGEVAGGLSNIQGLVPANNCSPSFAAAILVF